MTRKETARDEQGYVNAWLEDGEAFIGLNRDLWNRLYQSHISFDKNMKPVLDGPRIEIIKETLAVRGLGGRCREIYVSPLGESMTFLPLVFFVMEDGSLEYLDPGRQISRFFGQMEFFTSDGPLAGLRDIQSLIMQRSKPEDPYMTGSFSLSNRALYALDRQGRSYKLRDYIPPEARLSAEDEHQ